MTVTWGIFGARVATIVTDGHRRAPLDAICVATSITCHAPAWEGHVAQMRQRVATPPPYRVLLTPRAVTVAKIPAVVTDVM